MEFHRVRRLRKRVLAFNGPKGSERPNRGYFTTVQLLL